MLDHVVLDTDRIAENDTKVLVLVRGRVAAAGRPVKMAAEAGGYGNAWAPDPAPAVLGQLVQPVAVDRMHASLGKSAGQERGGHGVGEPVLVGVP